MGTRIPLSIKPRGGAWWVRWPAWIALFCVCGFLFARYGTTAMGFGIGKGLRYFTGGIMGAVEKGAVGKSISPVRVLAVPHAVTNAVTHRNRGFGGPVIKESESRWIGEANVAGVEHVYLDDGSDYLLNDGHLSMFVRHHYCVVDGVRYPWGINHAKYDHTNSPPGREKKF